MAVVITQPAYSAFTAITISLASLATSATLIAGREGVTISNASTLYDDIWLSGYITVGTTPTVGQIIVYAFGALDATPVWPDQMTGADANRSITSIGLGQGFLKRAAIINVDATTSNIDYPFGPVSLFEAMGGVLPRDTGIYIAHNTVAALHATGGNHVIKYQGITFTNT